MPSRQKKQKQKNKMPEKKNKSTASTHSSCNLRSKEWLDDLEGQISETTAAMQSESATPMATSESPNNLDRTNKISTHCIYTVPDSFTIRNVFIGDDYHPQVVSIGPLRDCETWSYDHHPYSAMAKHKLEFLILLLQRTQLRLDDLLQSIRPHEKEAKECYRYSEAMTIESINTGDRFLKLMVLDGCFLIELFRKANKQFIDPQATIPRAGQYFFGDLLKVENQIPFFVLEKLFETSKILPEESHDSLSLFALQFFNKVMKRPKGVIEKFLNQLPPDKKPLHLLDLVRSSFLTPDLVPVPVPPKNNETRRLFPSVSKLGQAGIELKLTKKPDSFLDVKFRNGVIKMPNIVIDHSMKVFLLNCVVFERLHNSLSKHFTVYAAFLDCLVDTAGDVGHLCERNIFDSFMGDYDKVASFINEMGQNLVFADDQFYLSQLFEDVNERYRTSYKVQWASFKLTYFNTPWSFISALAAFVLLVLTFLQTYYTIYAYVNPKA